MIAYINDTTGIEVDKITLIMIDEEKTHVIVDGVMIGIDNNEGQRILDAFKQLRNGMIYDYKDKDSDTYRMLLEEGE